MGGELILQASSFIIVIMSLLLLFLLYRININRDRWELKSLSIIPSLFFLIYLYIGMFEPPVEVARVLVRTSITTGLGVALSVSFRYLQSLRKRGL